MVLSSLSSSSLPMGISLSTQNVSFYANHSTIFQWGWSREVVDGRLLRDRRRKGKAIHVLANANVSPEKGDSKKEVFMVDPLEAKRLAAQQLVEIKVKENFRDSGAAIRVCGTAMREFDKIKKMKIRVRL